MSNQAVKDFDQAGGRIVGDFKAIIADSEDLLKAATTMSGDSLASARAKFENRLGRAKTALSEATQPMIDRTRQTAAAADGYVHDNPWSAIGVALAAGALIGMLAARR